MNHAELIELSLDVAAEHADDLIPLAYGPFFKQYPEAEAEFGIDPDDHSKGKMLMSMIMEITEQAESNVYPDNIRRVISDHRAYGLDFTMYHVMFNCLLNAIKQLNGEHWNDAINSAWQAQFDKYMVYVTEAYEAK